MGKKLSIVVLEDDTYFAHYMMEMIQSYGEIKWCKNKTQFLGEVNPSEIDILIADLNLEGSSRGGLDIIKKISSYPKLQTIIVSSSEDETLIEEAYNLGVHHFLIKEKLAEFLPVYLNNLIRHHVKNDVLRILESEFITQDESILGQVLELFEQNFHDKTILMTGPTGTGKTHLAELIHRLSHSKDKPFIALNCAELSEEIIESELFGHKKGSFTGATENQIGKLKLADGGVLFLDEIGTMSLRMQQKLLKAIEEKSFYPMGSNKIEKSRFTLISATCDDLKQMVLNKKFREDFYFRISGFNIYLPPLKDRKKDIEMLIGHYLKLNPRKIILKSCALRKLQDYDWPGNVRELKKTLYLLSEKKKGIILKEDINLTTDHQKASPHVAHDHSYEEIISIGLKNYLQNIERLAIEQAMKINDGKITSCIKDLKISSSSFYRILAQ